jgi:hypothetical protein
VEKMADGATVNDPPTGVAQGEVPPTAVQDEATDETQKVRSNFTVKVLSTFASGSSTCC